MTVEDNGFATCLKKLRKEHKLTIRELAERSDTSHSYLSQLENSRRNPPKPLMIKQLSKGLSGNDDSKFLRVYNLLMKEAGYNIDWQVYDEVYQDSTGKILKQATSPEFVKATFNHNVEMPIYLNSNNEGCFYFFNDDGPFPDDIQEKLRLMIKTILD